MLSANVRVLAFVASCTVMAVSAIAVRAADTKMISSVEVQELDGVTRIVLRGAVDPIYTAFKREDPPRLIVELPDVEFSGIDSPLKVSNGVVNDVTLGAFGDPRVALSMARVTVGLAQDVEYELLPEGDELVIELRASGAAAPVADSGSSTTTAAPPAAAAPAADILTPVEKTEPAPAKTEDAPVASTSSRILKVRAAENGVHVVADGAIDNIDSFTLDNPSRLVVDFWGVDSKVWPDKQDVDWSHVTRVRVGKHADKVRVVLDLRGPLVSHGVEPVSDGVSIHMETDAAADAATATDAPADTAAIELPAAADASQDDSAADGEVMTEATDDAAADDSADAATDVADDAEVMTGEGTLTPPAQDWTGPGAIENVHFESLPGTDRVVVSLNHPVEAEMVSPDDATLIVMLRETSIPTDSERRVDTSDFGGPVEHFSVFKTPDVDYQEVRVVLKRSAGQKGSMKWHEGQLYIELDRESAGGADWDPAASADGTAPGGTEGMDGAAAAMATTTGDPADTSAPVPAAALSDGSMAPANLAADDPFLLDGPADPAAIDLLAEGGFSEEKEYTGRRISLDFKDADIGNILRLIAEVSDLNVIAGEEVEGKVTIRLVDVPWDQALDVILLTKGLGFVRVGNVLRIAPLETLKLEAEARLQDRRAKEKLEDLIVKLQPVNYASVKEIKDLVKKLLSKRGTVNTDKRTNTLIIKDIPSVVQEATALVKAIDTATPQVLIESKIVEATLSFSRSLGATWGAGFQPSHLDGTTSGGGGGDVHLNDGTTFPDVLGLTGSGSNFIAANPIFDANNGFLSLGILGLNDHLQLDLALEAAETNNKGKVISSPRIVTLDNREAVIKQGVAIKFEAATRDKITISFIDAVLELKVTPHITANRSIIMKIKISRNAPSLSAATGDIVGIDKNEATTEALVRDGETMVLGGIYIVDGGTNRSKTPFLADIPLLGSVFQSKVTQDERRELLIFVTPRIIMGTPGTTDL